MPIKLIHYSMRSESFFVPTRSPVDYDYFDIVFFTLLFAARCCRSALCFSLSCLCAIVFIFISFSISLEYSSTRINHNLGEHCLLLLPDCHVYFGFWIGFLKWIICTLVRFPASKTSQIRRGLRVIEWLYNTVGSGVCFIIAYNNSCWILRWQNRFATRHTPYACICANKHRIGR